MLKHTTDGSSIAIPLRSCHKAGDPPLSGVPQSSGCYGTPVERRGLCKDGCYRVWRWLHVIDDMGSSAAGGQCMLSTHTCTHTGNSRNGCRSTNKHKSIASPTPFTSICVHVTLSVFVHIFSDQTTRNYGTHFVDSTLRSWAVVCCGVGDGLPLYLKGFLTFPIRVNIGEKILETHFNTMQSNTKPSQTRVESTQKSVSVS